jgi:hypothetical protein
MKKFVFFFSVLLLGGITFFFPLNQHKRDRLDTAEFRIEKKTAASGNKYNYYFKGKNRMKFLVQRPLVKDTNILLCIPAAFTRLGDLKVDGFYMVEGVAGNTDSINRRIGGALKIAGDEISFISTSKGKIFTKGYIDSLSKEKASLFQQIYMVRNFAPENSNSKNKYQCRGIALMYNGEVCVVESEADITLKEFAADVAGKDNVKELMYTDMGAWDEGWYRDPKSNKPRIIGNNRSQTSKQSNWIIFQKP